MAELYAGTSGFAYPNWKPGFYPQKLPQKQFLEHYATRLNSVEINYSFRRTPAGKTLEAWVQQVPENFRFCFKAHQRITHIHRLKDAREATEFFLRALDPLRITRRLGAVLFQLPPNFRCDLELLAKFLGELPEKLQYAFEFRHPSWHDDDVYRLLEKHNACLCQAESEMLKAPEVITADFVYFRLRMPEYTPENRQVIAQKARELVQQNKTLFLFFKHEDAPDGALYAEEILQQPRLTASPQS